MLFRKAKVWRVMSPNHVELEFQLDFGISARAFMTLSEVERSETIPEQDYKKAIHALVVMVGGKEVIVSPDTPDGFQSSRAKFKGKLYRAGRLEGFTSKILEEDAICINDYLKTMGTSFEISTVQKDWRSIK